LAVLAAVSCYSQMAAFKNLVPGGSMGITLGVPRPQFVYIYHIAQLTLTNIIWLEHSLQAQVEEK